MPFLNEYSEASFSARYPLRIRKVWSAADYLGYPLRELTDAEWDAYWLLYSLMHKLREEYHALQVQ